MARTSLIDKWTAYLRTERGLSPATLAAYRYTIETFAEYLDRRRPPRQLRHARREDVRGFVGEIIEASTPGAARSACQRLSALRSFYRILEIDGTIRKSPTQFVEFPKRWKTLPRFLAVEEVFKLLDVDSSTLRNRAIIELLFGSGIRVSELTAARLSDLNLEARVLLVHGKGDKERSVPLGGPIVRLLREYLANRNSSSPYIFVSEPNAHRRRDQLTRQWIWRLVRDRSNLAGLGKVKPHTLRHSCATALLENGADLRTIQMILGHESIDTTEIYAHTSTKYVRAEYERVHACTHTCTGKKAIRTTQRTGTVERARPFAKNHSMRNG